MNSIIQNIISRRSIRNFKPDMPTEEEISLVLKAGTFAASGMNRQSPIIIAVTNKKLRDELSKLNAEIMGNPGCDPFYGAPVVLVVLADKNACAMTYVYDGACVIQNMMLAAHSIGLGSCWIHRAKEEFNTEFGKKILADLGIHGEYEGIGHCILGYPDCALPEPKERKSNYVYYVR